MMDKKSMPKIFRQLQSEEILKETEVLQTQDGFWLAYRSLADILSEKAFLIFRIQREKDCCAAIFLTTGFYMQCRMRRIMSIVC